MKIIVTGAGGLIGSHCSKLLQKNGYDVVSVYKTSTPKVGNLIIGDLTDPECLAKISNYRPDIVIHCAAVLPGINDHTVSTVAPINKLIDENIIDICQKGDCKLIYISGTIVYDFSNEISSESSPLGIMSDYIKEKHNTENNIQKQLRDYIILRVSAPYGPKQKSNTVLKKFIHQVINNQPIKYFGTGNRRQDFTHVDDVANAILLSLNNVESGIYNIASGRPISMFDLAVMIKSIFPESTSKIEASNSVDPEENYRACYDISKAKEKLGWEPTIYIEEGVVQMANYAKQIK